MAFANIKFCLKSTKAEKHATSNNVHKHNKTFTHSTSVMFNIMSGIPLFIRIFTS